MLKLLIYKTSNNREPLIEWIESLGDLISKARISDRLERMKKGNFGDSKYIGSEIYELRLFFSSGYRVYYGKIDNIIVLLLCGGNKKTQKKDIKKAKIYFKDYKSNSYGKI